MNIQPNFLNPPSDTVLLCWQNILKDFYGVEFDFQVLNNAYFMDIGYREAMLFFSPFSKEDKTNSQLIFDKSFRYWLDEDGSLSIDLDTELRESLYEKAHLIKFGRPAKTYGT